MSAKGFQAYAASSYDIYLTLAEATAFREVFFRLYPELRDWHVGTKLDAEISGVAVLTTGRVRHLPNVYSPNEYLKSKALRQAINTPVQGTASEIMLLGMLSFSERVIADPTIQVIGQCHDAIFVECPDNPVVIEHACINIEKCLTGVSAHPLLKNLPWDIPLEVEIKVGKCWGDQNAEVWKKSS